jgi:hypothetical protein
VAGTEKGTGKIAHLKVAATNFNGNGGAAFYLKKE